MYDEMIALRDEAIGNCEPRAGEAKPIADVLAELLAEYQTLFPHTCVDVVGTAS